MLVNIFYSTVFKKWTISSIFNGLSDHDAHLLIIQYCNSNNKKTENNTVTVRKISKISKDQFKMCLSYEI